MIFYFCTVVLAFDPGTSTITQRSCIYLKDGTATMYLLVYVDDIIVLSSLSTAVDRLVLSLRQEFVVKDLGPLHYFLGLEVTPVPDGLALTQKKYALDLLRRAGML